ncbi:MAG TPA: NADH-quinone oxidoreductase subunit J [Tepidiformaceae bacterium]|nr:NADH-quinone oxidoreductase subunit J [Tepidiformaceae bacterium]
MDGVGVTIAFWILAVITVGAALGVMAARNLLHAVLFLILAFIGVAGFFLLLSAEFLAMAQIIIYVGAIAVLVLFAILLTPYSGRGNGETRMVLPAGLLALCLAAIFIFVLTDTNWTSVNAAPGVGVTQLGEALLSTWVLPFEMASVLLTAALVGALMLARNPGDDSPEARP